MRRFLAYIVMMVTLVFALIFNTQAVLDQKTDAMEYGSADIKEEGKRKQL